MAQYFSGNSEYFNIKHLPVMVTKSFSKNNPTNALRLLMVLFFKSDDINAAKNEVRESDTTFARWPPTSSHAIIAFE